MYVRVAHCSLLPALRTSWSVAVKFVRSHLHVKVAPVWLHTVTLPHKCRSLQDRLCTCQWYIAVWIMEDLRACNKLSNLSTV